MSQILNLQAYARSIIWGGEKLFPVAEKYHPESLAGYQAKNLAELWTLSAHPNGESLVTNGTYKGYKLSQVFKENSMLFGLFAAGYDVFPLLIKFIDAMDNLSMQSHPSDDYLGLKAGESGKEEWWHILDCAEGAELILGFKHELTRAQFKKAVEEGTLEEYVLRVPVKPGDSYYIPTGTLHAICRGVLLAEVQQSSDTTYRVYDYDRTDANGKKRELHISDALAVTHREEYEFGKFYLPNNENLRTQCLTPENPYFTVRKLMNNGQESLFMCPANENSFISVTGLSGEGILSVAGEDADFEIGKGSSLIVPARCAFDIRGNESFSCLHTTINPPVSLTKRNPNNK